MIYSLPVFRGEIEMSTATRQRKHLRPWSKFPTSTMHQAEEIRQVSRLRSNVIFAQFNSSINSKLCTLPWTGGLLKPHSGNLLSVQQAKRERHRGEGRVEQEREGDQQQQEANRSRHRGQEVEEGQQQVSLGNQVDNNKSPHVHHSSYHPGG